MTEARDCATGCEARERYSDGRNCAQGVIGALSGAEGLPDCTDSIGAGFTGGIGHSGCVCGALAGGVTMLGEHAKTAGLEPMATRLLAEELSADLHTRFAERHSAACCRVIKRGQTPGSDEWLSGCADITEWTAATVSQIVAERGGSVSRRRWAFTDALSSARRVALSILAAGAVALLASTLVPVSARPVVVTGVFVALSATGMVMEVTGAAGRRVARVLRVVGGACAAALLVAPDAASAAALSTIAADTGGVVVVRVGLALAAVLVAGTAVFGLKRYR